MATTLASKAPEQTLAEGEEELITTAGSALREDEVFSVLSELAAVSKVHREAGKSRRQGPVRPGWRRRGWERVACPNWGLVDCCPHSLLHPRTCTVAALGATQTT